MSQDLAPTPAGPRRRVDEMTRRQADRSTRHRRSVTCGRDDPSAGRSVHTSLIECSRPRHQCQRVWSCSMHGPLTRRPAPRSRTTPGQHVRPIAGLLMWDDVRHAPPAFSTRRDRAARQRRVVLGRCGAHMAPGLLGSDTRPPDRRAVASNRRNATGPPGRPGTPVARDHRSRCRPSEPVGGGPSIASSRVRVARGAPSHPVRAGTRPDGRRDSGTRRGSAALRRRRRSDAPRSTPAPPRATTPVSAPGSPRAARARHRSRRRPADAE